MKRLPFTKASACGNDFLIIDAALAPADIQSFSRKLCERRNGLGADGVEWVSPGIGGADVVARLINADGSEAEVSGNGTRCVAAFWILKHGGQLVRVLTGAGLKQCSFVGGGSNIYQFEMNMGEPQVKDRKRVAGIDGLVVSMGNPHFVMVVSGLDIDWQSIGAKIQSSGEFPQGTNVEFVRPIGRHILEARFFERGVGATHSSGTGSCAAAVAAIKEGIVESPVTVAATGGDQVVRWEKDVYLSGPAQIICEGEYFL
jgi:diaminopimelate epimerase